MTPNLLAATLRTVGWTHAQFARMLGKDVSIVRRMLGVKEPPRRIPDKLARWLGGLLEHHLNNPLPKDWDSD